MIWRSFGVLPDWPFQSLELSDTVMHQGSRPEHLCDIRGLVYRPTSQDLSGQMAIALALASIADRKRFKRKSQSAKRLENPHWLAAAQQVSSQIGVQRQMTLDDFESVLDLYPDRRVVIYSSQTNQPAPGGIFNGPDYHPEMAEDKTLWIYHDQENDHYSSIENMQAYSRSTNTHRDHLFCAKCCGWVTKRKLHTHRCIYEFRCIDCGNHELNSSGDLMYHRNRKVHGTWACEQCGKDMAGGLCIQHHEFWCNSNNLEWVTCETCSKKYAVNWTHVCHHLWCNKCLRHYPEEDQHRCFISKDKHRRGPDASIVSPQTAHLPESNSYFSSGEEQDEEVVDKKPENRFMDVEVHQSKRPKMNHGSRHYAYDMESMLTSVSMADGTTKDRHDAILIVVRQLYCESEDNDSYWVFRSIDVFFEFALKKKRSYFWAHNAQGYDSQLLFSHITHHSTVYEPKNIIFRGEKLLQFCVNTTKFRDSMCHLASALDSLPKMLGFSGNWKKGFFPHKLNTPKNQDYVGLMPDRSFFEPDEMKPDRKAEFDKWYEEESETNAIWDFQESLVAYCKADVLVLARALEKYDTLMKRLNDGISPLTNITLASYALTVFRNLHMPDDCLVVSIEDEHRFAAEALHGGKTDVRILHREWIKEQIDRGIYGCYVDVQSMYPYVQYTREMPCGVPSWRTFDEVDLDFLQSFIGFAKCDIHPTRYLHHPVIGGKDPNTGKYVLTCVPRKGSY
ncbi:DNA polymerase type B, organellar and viral-domain-containing protein [Gorgonomyces haynaldii]|nr:DNA polymerase type B, organellar and viral-domain-containing protein [Gorgonomyces haynaldii]